jgi:hypothetical protein
MSAHCISAKQELRNKGIEIVVLLFLYFDFNRPPFLNGLSEKTEIGLFSLFFHPESETHNFFVILFTTSTQHTFLSWALFFLLGAYFKGWPRTPKSITSDCHALPFYALQKAAPEAPMALWPLQGWPPATAGSLWPSSTPWTPYAVRLCF